MCGTLSNCVFHCIHTCGMHGQELVNCIQMMIGMK